MSFGRQKRLLLGWLALLAPIPLPFNEVLGWPRGRAVPDRSRSSSCGGPAAIRRAGCRCGG